MTSSAFDIGKIRGSSITHNVRGFKSVQLKQFDCFKNTSYSKFCLNTFAGDEIRAKSLHKNCKTGNLLGLGLFVYREGSSYFQELLQDQ